MSVHTGKSFTGDVELDGQVYRACTFSKAVLVYRGGHPPGFEGCSFVDVRITFADHAQRTVQLLQAMSRPESGFQQIIRATFPDL